MRWGMVGFLLVFAMSVMADNPRLHFSDSPGDIHHGGAVGGKASGVHFYEVKAVGEERIGKFTLVR